MLKGGVRTPEGVSEGKPKAAKPGWLEEKSRGSPHAALQHSVGSRGNLLRGQFFHSAPSIVTGSDFQNHEVYWPMKQDKYGF